MPTLTEPVLTASRLAGLDQPTLTVDELTLRPWRPDDAGSVLQAYSDPAVRRWHVRSVDDLGEAGDWIADRARLWSDHRGVDWAVADSERVLGRIGLGHFAPADGEADVAYWTLPAARGRAVAARATDAAARWAFGVVGFHRLELTHSTRNTASCRAAVKAGFAVEGTKRGQGLHADGWHDMHLHARLADDPAPTS